LNTCYSDSSPLLSNDHMFETMVVELEELLARLSRINDKMVDYTHNLGKLILVGNKDFSTSIFNNLLLNF